MKKRILATLLAICMVLSAVPAYASSENEETEKTPKVLLWSTGTGKEVRNPLIHGSDVLPTLERIYQDLGYTVVTQVSASARHFSSDADLAKDYDLVFILFPSIKFNEEDKAALKAYMEAGGRVAFQCEDPDWSPVSNESVSNLLQDFNANIKITSVPDYSGTANLNLKSKLSDNVGTLYPYIVPGVEYSHPAQAVATTPKGTAFIIDRAVFKGRVTLLTDINFYTEHSSDTSPITFFKNLLTDSQANKEKVEQGEDPNDGFGDKKLVTYKYQAAASATRPLPEAISDPSAEGDYQVSDPKTYAVDESVTRLDPAQSTYQEIVDGKTIGTWKLSWDADTGTMTESGLTFTGTWSFTSAYRPPTVYYSVSYETSGGTVYAPERVAAGSLVWLNKTPVWEGFTFTGWYTDAACTNPVDSIRVNENLTVYAGWALTGVPPQLNSVDHCAYVQGYGDETVRPESPVTRAEVAAMLYRLLKTEYRQEVPDGAVLFPDVTPGRWYYKEASSLALGGYLKGYPDGTFRGDRQITRAEFAAVAVRFLCVRPDAACDFSDVAPSHWAYPYIATAETLGWMQGNGGAFAPERSITRAEAMTVINRMLERGVSGGTAVSGYRTWTDNPKNAWYYWEVVEAANSHDYTGKRPGEVWTGLTDARFDR